MNFNNTNLNLEQPIFYQIDFIKKSLGKLHSKSKRHITWKFGIANQKALSMGKTGHECRGNEYEIQLIWSISSGKQRILFNDEDIYYCNRQAKNKNKQTDRVAKSWKMKLDDDESNEDNIKINILHNHHAFKIVADAYRPMYQKKNMKGYHQFNLFINGCSFFNLPKIFEIVNTTANTTSKYNNSTAYKMSRLLASGSSVDIDDHGYFYGLRPTRSFENKLYNYNDSIDENEHIKDNQHIIVEKEEDDHNVEYDLLSVETDDYSRISSITSSPSSSSSPLVAVEDLLNLSSSEYTSPRSSATYVFSLFPPNNNDVKTNNNNLLVKDCIIDDHEMCSALNKSKNNRVASLKDNDIDNMMNNNACYLAVTEDNKNHHNNVSTSLNNSIIATSITTGSIHDIEERQQNQNNDYVTTTSINTATIIVSHPKKQNPFDNVMSNDSTFFDSLLSNSTSLST